MATVRTGVIKVPLGTTDVTRYLFEHGARTGEKWDTEDGGRTWTRDKKGLGGNAEVPERYTFNRNIERNIDRNIDKPRKRRRVARQKV